MSAKRSDPGDEQEKQSKKPRTLEPDVVVVVGGTNFQENSYFLRSCSGYFDAAFWSGMKEQNEMKFEFPDKDPEEWELIRELLKPFGEEEIKEGNIEVVLSWFEELCIQDGLKQCERVLCNKILPQYLPLELEGEEENEEEEFNELEEVDKYFDLSVKYNLKDAQERCLQKIIHFFEEFPSSLCLDHFQQIPSFLAVADEQMRGRFWVFIRENCRVKSLGMDLDDENANNALLANPLFPHLIWKDIQLDHRTDELREKGSKLSRKTRQLESIVRVVKAHNGESRLKRTLKSEKSCSNLFG